MTRTYLDYLQDMRDNARRAVEFVKGMDYKDFASDEKTVYAVIRAVEIIGEAAANIPEEIQSKHSGIPWREVGGMRNKLVHRYFGINMEVVWQTVQDDLPMIVPTLERALELESERDEG